MKIAYLDCFSGISGDMLLGALLDLGLGIENLREELKRLPLSGYSISAWDEKRHQIKGTRVVVKLTEDHPQRCLADINGIISRSSLSDRVKALSIAIFKDLGKAEAKVHGCNVDDVHFHEVGAVDSIIDIMGAVIGLEKLGIEEVFASPIPTGSGLVNSAHGVIPVPAPATIELLNGIPVVDSLIKYELTTPTAAAILKNISGGFGGIPDMVVESTGYGTGSMDFEEVPNLLRIIVGRVDGSPERLLCLETNIDDMDPQIYDYIMDRLFEVGAIDCFLTPIHMKKGRPGILLNVLSSYEHRDAVIDRIFEETTTLGIRSYEVDRFCLERLEEVVSTPSGEITLKVSFRNGRRLNAKPEYEDCKRIAADKGVPLKQVIDEAKVAYHLKCNN